VVLEHRASLTALEIYYHFYSNASRRFFPLNLALKYVKSF